MNNATIRAIQTAAIFGATSEVKEVASALRLLGIDDMLAQLYGLPEMDVDALRLELTHTFMFCKLDPKYQALRIAALALKLAGQL